MPLSPTTAYNPGDGDPGKTYDKIKIMSLRIDLEKGRIELRCARGYLDGNGIFVEGAVTGRETHYIKDIPAVPDDLDVNGNPIPGTGTPADPQFSTIIAKTGATGTPIYTSASIELYQWLIDKDIYAGTIDP